LAALDSGSAFFFRPFPGQPNAGRQPDQIPSASAIAYRLWDQGEAAALSEGR
jgi:hypothetical protein